MPDQPLIELLDEMLAQDCDTCETLVEDRNAALAALKAAVEALEIAMDAAIYNESSAAGICDTALSTINQLIRSARE